MKTKQIFALVLFPVLFFISSCAGSPDVNYGGFGRGTDPVPLLGQVRTGKLASGLRYYILENKKPENRAYLTLAVKAGSVLEKDDEQGIAHFVEHMAFEDTERFPGNELVDYLRSLGMRFGPEINAYTSYDQTVYGIEVPVDSAARRVPDRALAVIDDWTRAVTFEAKAVDEERRVILEEYRTHLGPNERVRRRMIRSLFAGSPYADRLPIGLPEIIQSVPAAALRDFYRAWYRPGNMALIFVGDFDGAALEASLETHFTIRAPEVLPDRPDHDLPPPKKGSRKIEIFRDPELSGTRVELYYKRNPAAREGTLASYREMLLDNLIDTMAALRFNEAMSKSETPYTSGGSGIMDFPASSRFYIFIADAKPAAAGPTLEALLKEKESMTRYGFTDAELERAKASLVSGLTRGVSEKDRQESSKYVDELTYHYLEKHSMPDIEWELNAANSLLPHIGAKDIDERIRDYFSGDDLSVYISAQENEPLPSVDEITAILANAKNMPVDPPKEGRAEGALLEPKPRPGFVAAESKDGELGATILELGNGAKVILKETANKNNEIVLYALAKGGFTSAEEDEIVSFKLASEISAVSGLGPYTRPELVQRLADKQITFGNWAYGFTRGFQATSTNQDLETLFEIIHLVFSRSRADENAVAVILDQYRTELARRGENPEAVFFDEARKDLYGGNLWFRPLEQQDLAKLSIETVRAFLGRAFNPADYTFVFTGNLDLPAVKPLIETYIASLPRLESWNEWKDPGIVRPKKTHRALYKGMEEQSIVCLAWYAGEEYTEEGAALAEALTEYLDIILEKEIRGKLGGVYSISASASLSPLLGGELALSVYFFCDPERAEELSGAVEAELGKIARGEIDKETMVKAIEALKMSHEQSLQSNAYLARNIAQYLLVLGLPPSRLGKKPELYERVSPAGLERLADLLLPEGPMKLVLYPEKERP